MIMRKHIAKALLMLIGVTCPGQVSHEYLRNPQTGKYVPYAGKLSGKKVVIPSNYRLSSREMRGIWVATVRNIDFPVHAKAVDFKRNFIRLADNLKAANFNTLIFQIRPSNDAFYPSELNPWSRFVAGREGTGIPGFDPLHFMILETHKRGMEFHAWFNPYRVVGDTVLSKDEYLRTLSSKNFARRFPELVLCVRDGKNNMLLLNPGEPEVKKFILKTVKEVLDNYDVDAIHFDDYFYPYKDIGNADIFTFRKYNKNRLSLADWRRHNVDMIIWNTHRMINRHNSQMTRNVKFGVSPFGIWANRKDHPGGSLTQGLQSYSVQYADTRKWVRNNWLDYIVPQLYWTFETEAAPYAALADWWAGTIRGTKTQLYIGHAAYQPGQSARWRNPSELADQLRYNTRHPEIRGSCFFSYRSVFKPDHKLQRIAMEKIIMEYWKYPAVTP